MKLASYFKISALCVVLFSVGCNNGDDVGEPLTTKVLFFNAIPDVNSITIQVDGQALTNVSYSANSNYFDIETGIRSLSILDTSSDEILLDADFNLVLANSHSSLFLAGSRSDVRFAIEIDEILGDGSAEGTTVRFSSLRMVHLLNDEPDALQPLAAGYFNGAMINYLDPTGWFSDANPASFPWNFANSAGDTLVTYQYVQKPDLTRSIVVLGNVANNSIGVRELVHDTVGNL
ncbi:MAG: DUF4397 domain-containing protein [Cyclobacteriaceae bacterium]